MSGNSSAESELQWYDEDYLFFTSQTLGPERTENELSFIVQAIGIRLGDRILDLGCGHGRIANGLARAGANVTGIEVMSCSLERAKADATAGGLSVEYRQADIREPVSGGPYDAALLWFFTFGYHSDSDNCKVLQNVCSALKPGGKLLVDQYNTPALARVADHYTVLDFGDSLILQKPVWDLETARWGAERIVVRDGKIRRSRFMCRCYSAPELKRMLTQSGFSDIQFFGDGFQRIELSSTRMIALATK